MGAMDRLSIRLALGVMVPASAPGAFLLRGGSLGTAGPSRFLEHRSPDTMV
jgi:hypothetical protein